MFSVSDIIYSGSNELESSLFLQQGVQCHCTQKCGEHVPRSPICWPSNDQDTIMRKRKLPHPSSLTVAQRAEWRDALAGPRYAQQPHDLADGSRYYLAEEAGRIYVTKFHGKSLKPDRLAFRSQAEAERDIASFTARRQELADVQADRRASAKRPHTLTVGTVLVSSYGYEQTNVDFYEVIAVENRTVTLRQLAQERQDTSHMSGTTTPVPGHYTGDSIRKRVNPRNSVKLSSSSYAYPWDGRPQYWSSYA
ncbi:hypothetical protein [Xanthomonas albilineans]|uniref:hypothetical protein n=1 Tax=Xanthomonas albilineans TaxID=29447 RepID=UPI000B207D61|nr:hypothetical protein [Xanthomonas albilineans]